MTIHTEAQSRNDMHPKKLETEVVLLGTGTPNADPDRSGPSVAVLVGDAPYLVDAGPGVVRRAAAAFQNGVHGLDIEKIHRVFVTHLHSDHTAGFPDLILTPWVLGRKIPLQVFGPPGVQSMVEHILSAYSQDIRERLEGLEPANDAGYMVEVQEISEGVVYEDGLVKVEAMDANHGSWEAFSYKFTTPELVIVISGDTAPYEGMVGNYAGCDLLVHEVYSSTGFLSIPRKWQHYHASYHTSSKELAKLALLADPGKLILYHQLLWGVKDRELVLEIEREYSGEVYSGKDLDVYPL